MKLNWLFRKLLESLENDAAGLNNDHFVAENPDFSEAAVLLARHQIFSDPERALSAIEPIRPEMFYLIRQRI
ncbi:MAG: hypothetical protein R3B93_22445 [Bacteroidia bacterium]